MKFRSPARVGRVLEERERAVDDRRPDLLVAAPGQLERDDREARHVVDAVAALAVRDDAVRVLDDPDVVDEREQMVGRTSTRCGSRATERRRRGASSTASRRTAAVAAATEGHASCSPMRRASRGRRRARRLLDVVADGAARAAGSANGTIVPAPDSSMSCAYQYGVDTTPQPAASANVSAPDEICSRARYGVTKTSVAASRSAISSMLRKRSSNSTWTLEPEVEHAPLERHPVALSLSVGDVGMRPAGDQVEHVGVLLDDRRQRLDHRLEPLAGGDQPEGREQEAVVEPPGRLPARSARRARA